MKLSGSSIKKKIISCYIPGNENPENPKKLLIFQETEPFQIKLKN